MFTVRYVSSIVPSHGQKTKQRFSVFSCPHKGIISGKPVLCHVYADPSTNGFLPADVSKSEAAQHQRHNSVVDSCPKGFFCALHDRNTVGTGHCCPQDVFWCPVGQPELNRSCDSGDPNIPFCNYDTHECHQVELLDHSDLLDFNLPLSFTGEFKWPKLPGNLLSKALPNKSDTQKRPMLAD